MQLLKAHFINNNEGDNNEEIIYVCSDVYTLQITQLHTVLVQLGKQQNQPEKKT